MSEIREAKIVLNQDELYIIRDTLLEQFRCKLSEYDNVDWSKYPSWVKEDHEEEKDNIWKLETKFHNIIKGDYKCQSGEEIIYKEK